ncbi:hypothetical protein [Sporomusa aerivorans]|uniref:hypothetical protein n=1 Tax=Sporomusa aerivorans TaxID=204936 RepID=UPI00352A491F
MIYVLHCQITPGPKKERLEKAMRESAPYRTMTDTLWLIEADLLPKEVEAELQALTVKSFVAPLHPNGPRGGKLLPADKENQEILHIVHSEHLRDAEKEKLEKLVQDAGPARKLTDSFWIFKAKTMPKELDAYLQALNTVSFAAPLHPQAQCGGNLLAEDVEWIAMHTLKH